MFGFGKKKKEEKKHSKLDKLIMGAIVGGAVGSVIGMTIAPQKGKETREMISQKSKEIIKKGQDSLAQHQATNTHPGIFSKTLTRISNAIFTRNKKVKKDVMKDQEKHKKIPNEVE